MEDIRLDEDWQLTRAADGDAPVASDIEEFLQEIRLESMTQEGDLFYEPEYGWSLLDFIQREDGELTQVEIRERVKSKMAKHPEVDGASVQVAVEFSDEVIKIDIRFKQVNSEDTYMLSVSLDRIKVEVVEDD